MLEKLKNVFSTFIKKTLTVDKIDEVIDDLIILLNHSKDNRLID